MNAWLSARVVADRVIAALLLVPLAPVIVVVAMAKRLEDGGRAFVRIPRVGRHGASFSIVKVRTMKSASTGGLAGGPSLTAGDDARTTPLGRVLRTWRLDELPQVSQVVAGTMALIGPRPEADDYVDRTDEAWQVVLSAPPGIAGVSQLLVEPLEQGLPAASVEQDYRAHILPLKVRLDRWYVEHGSPLTDALVVFALVERFVLRRSPTLLARHVDARVPGFHDAYRAAAAALAA